MLQLPGHNIKTNGPILIPLEDVTTHSWINDEFHDME